VVAIGVHSAAEIEDPVTKFAAEANGGLIIAPHAVTLTYRKLIIDLAARYRLPAVYGFRIFATSGGLLSYGTNPRDQFRRGASYVDRVLKGEKPGVQWRSAFEPAGRPSNGVKHSIFYCLFELK
jgi:putative ABC transport system substrate-binding protein